MRIFKINAKIEIVCEWKKTRSAFKHEANLILNGIERDFYKVCYQNRTWEKFEFQSVMQGLINKTKELTQEEKEECLKFLEGDLTDWSNFKTTNLIAGLGDLFCETKKGKNDWKTRMLKAGLENKGLSFPEDWDNLTEEEKEKRLNLVTKQIENI